MKAQESIKISIVTPNYNSGAHIEQTIQSVLSQNYSNFEYIVIDGGSTDKSVQAIEKYSSALKYWTSEKDRGQSEAINKGLARATGDIVAYINSDDYYLPAAFDSVAQFFRKNPKVGMVHGGIRYVDVNGEMIRRQPAREFRWKKAVAHKERMDTIAQPTVFWRRSLLDEVGYFDESFHYVMDLDMWTRIAMRAQIGRLPLEIAAMRMHEQSKTMSSTTSANDQMRRERFRLREKLFENQDLPENLRRKKAWVLTMAAMWLTVECITQGNMAEAEFYSQKAVGNDPCVFRHFRDRLSHLCLQISHFPPGRRTEMQNRFLSLFSEEIPDKKKFRETIEQLDMLIGWENGEMTLSTGERLGCALKVLRAVRGVWFDPFLRIRVAKAFLGKGPLGA